MKNNKRDSVNDVTTFLLGLEVDLQLFEWKIEDLHIWELIRVPVYSKIREDANVDISFTKKSLLDRWKYFYERIIINSFLKFPFFNHRKKDSLVFESSRKYLVEGNYIDIYTHYMCDDLTKNKKSYQKYQSSYSFDKLDANRKGILHLDFIYFFSKLYSIFIKLNLPVAHLEKISEIENLVLDKFNVVLNLKDLIISSIKKYKSEYPFYNYLLKIKSPKEIFIVNFSDKLALISAAKKRSIKTIEIQHGLMVKEDLIYHYPHTEKDSLKYFPDFFYVWGDIWGNSVRLPISDHNIILWGNKHIESQAKSLNNSNKDNIILFISQPGLTDDIFKIVLDNIKELLGYKIIIKLHPIEFNTFGDSEYYTRLKKNKNIEFIKNEKSIYYLFSISKVCCGVYSAALIESLYFNLELVLLNLKGVEMLSFLISNKKAQLLNKPFNLKQILVKE